MNLLGGHMAAPAAAIDRDLEQVLLGLADGSYVLSTPDGSVAESGMGVVGLLGTPAERLVGQPIADVLIAGADEQARGDFEQLLRAPSVDPSARRTFSAHCAEGTTRSLQFVVVSVPLALGWEFTSLLSELRSRDAGTWHPDQLRLRHGRALEAVEGVVRQGTQPDPSARLAGILIVVRDVDAAPLTHEDVDRRMAEQRAAARAAAAEAAHRIDKAAGRVAAGPDEEDAGAHAPGLEDLVERARVLRERVEDAEREAAAATLERDELLGRLAEAEAERDAATALAAGASDAEGRLAHLASERDEARARLGAMSDELDASRRQAESARTAAAAAQAELASARAAADAAQADVESARAEGQAARAQAESARAEAEAAGAAAQAAQAAGPVGAGRCAGHPRRASGAARAGRIRRGQRSVRPGRGRVRPRRRRDRPLRGRGRPRGGRRRSQRGAVLACRGAVRSHRGRVGARRRRAPAGRAAGDARGRPSRAHRAQRERRRRAGRAARRERGRPHRCRGTARGARLRPRGADRGARRARPRARRGVGGPRSAAEPGARAQQHARTARRPGRAAHRDRRRAGRHARTTLDATRAELESARAELAAQVAELEGMRAELDRAQAETATALAAAEEVRAEREHARQRAEQLMGEAEQARAAADAIRAEFAFEPFADAGSAQQSPPAHRTPWSVPAVAAPAAAEAAAQAGPPKPDLPAVAPGEAAALIAMDGSFKRLDDAFCSLLGCREEDLRAARWPSIIDRENLKAHGELARALKAGEIASAEVETVYMHAQGLLVPISGTISLHRPEGDGEPHFLFRADVSRTAGVPGVY